MKSLKTASLLPLLLLLHSACSQIQPAARSEDGLPKIAPPILREVRVDPRLGRSMFGIDLRPQARILWAEIEGRYGRPVRELLTDDLGYTYYAGLASVDPDGTPVVELINTEHVTEERIVHELYHLKLYTEGFPVIRVEYPAGWKEESQQARVRYIIAQIYDTIEHRIFYPGMREIGLTPDENLKSSVEANLQEGGTDDEEDTGVPGLTRKDELTLQYFKVALLTEDRQLLERLTNQYRSRRWDEALNTGRAMAQLVTAAQPSTPNEAVMTLMRCLDVMERAVNVYKLSGWETERMGQHERRRVYLRVAPRSKRGSKYNT